MYKKLLALSLALVLCVCPVFAVSDSDNSYYSFDPVPDASVGHFLLNAVTSANATTGWTDTDHNYLNQIRLALTSNTSGTLLGYIYSIDASVRSFDNKLFAIKQNTDYLPNISNNTNDAKSLLTQIQLNLDKLSTAWTNDRAASVSGNLSDVQSLFSYLFADASWPTFDGGTYTPNATTFTNLFGNSLIALGYDVNLFNGERSLYGRIKQLQETLASDEDKALSDAQKSNRDQITQDFVSGSSGKTSLGPSDFGDLSSVGGSVKDSISLNGQSSISGFTGGLSDSDEAGQGWFSAETRDALDSVSSSSSYGLKREKGNSDIYNMAGFSDHYSWLYGD